MHSIYFILYFRVQISKQKGRRYFFGSLKGSVDKNRKICSYKMYEKSLQYYRAGIYVLLGKH